MAEEEDTETKLAILSSIFTSASQQSLFDILIKAEGNIPKAIDLHLDSSSRDNPPRTTSPPPKRVKTSHESPTKSLNSILKWTSSAEPPRKVVSLL
jgi:hypothetical protein